MKISGSLFLYIILAASVVAIWIMPANCMISCVIEKTPNLKAKYQNISPYVHPDNTPKVFSSISNKTQQQKAISMVRTWNDQAASTESALHSGGPVTCAVVGNSGNLRGSGYGKQIDQHTYVFRMNSAPVSKYSKDVGRRTTHHVLFSDQRVRLYQPNTITILIVKTRGFDMNEHYARSEYTKDIAYHLRLMSKNALGQSITKVTGLKVISQGRGGGTRILSDEFIYYITDNWWTPPIEQQEDRTPSTGFKTLILALHVCDQVDIFGFGPDKSGFWDHYYDKKMMPTRRGYQHLPKYQEKVLMQMEKDGLIRIYRGHMIRKPIVR